MFRNCRTVSKRDCSHENKQVLEEANKPCTAYNFRRSNIVMVPRFNSPFLKNSICYRAAILWNAVSTHFTNQFTVFYRKVKKDSYFKELDFGAQSLPRHYQDFKCFELFYVLHPHALVNLLRGNYVCMYVGFCDIQNK